MAKYSFHKKSILVCICLFFLITSTTKAQIDIGYDSSSNIATACGDPLSIILGALSVGIMGLSLIFLFVGIYLLFDKKPALRKRGWIIIIISAIMFASPFIVPYIFNIISKIVPKTNCK